MSTLGQQAAGRGADLGIRLGLLAIFWPLLGWLGDLPSRVRPRHEEALLARFAAWVSALSWAFAALLISAPVWGLAITLVASLIALRRFAAHHGLPVRMSQLDSAATSLTQTRPWLLVALPVGLLLTLIPAVHFIGAATLIAFAAAAGITAGQQHGANQRLYGMWVPAIASVFAVSESVVLDQAGLTSTDDFGVVIRPVPPAIAQKLVDRAALDDRVAALDAGLMLDPGSTPDRIVITEATPEHLAVRAQRQQSGGLIVGGPVSLEEPYSAYGPDHGFGTPSPPPPSDESFWG